MRWSLGRQKTRRHWDDQQEAAAAEGAQGAVAPRHLMTTLSFLRSVSSLPFAFVTIILAAVLPDLAHS